VGAEARPALKVFRGTNETLLRTTMAQLPGRVVVGVWADGASARSTRDTRHGLRAPRRRRGPARAGAVGRDDPRLPRGIVLC
jgi:hypothetical protein